MKKTHRIVPATIIATGALAIALYFLHARQTGSHDGPAALAGHHPRPAPAAVAQPAGPVLAKEAPPGHIPDRELFGSAWRSSPHGEIAAFSTWTRSYLDAKSGARAAMRAEGLRLGAARREMMSQLIKTDPREAIANTLPVLVRQQLPQEIQDLLEERVSDRGDVFRIMGIAGPGDKTVVPTVEQAMIGPRVFQAHRYGDRSLSASMKDVSIHGIALDGHLAILDSPVRKLEEGETAAETTAECVITGGTQVVPEGQKREDVEITTMLVGNHGYTMCCPFCSEDFETRMERLERQAMSAPQAVDSIAADADEPRSLSSSGVNGSADYPGKPPYGLTHGTNTMIMMRVDFPDHTGNRFSDAELKGNIEWDPLESTCRHASLSIL